MSDKCKRCGACKECGALPGGYQTYPVYPYQVYPYPSTTPYPKPYWYNTTGGANVSSSFAA